MPGKLNRPGLVHIDMPRARADNAFVRREHGIDDHGVCLRASYQKKHVRLRRAAGRADFFPGALAIDVLAVSDELFPVGFHQPAQNLFMGSFQIVALKVQHSFSLLSAL